MTPRHVAVAIAWAPLAFGCASDDPGGLRAPPSCEGAEPLELGRCIDMATGSDCMGLPDEDPRFEPVADGDPLRLVTGPQGSSMFVVAIRTEGIAAGNPDRPVSVESPLVEITVVDEAGETVAVLRRYSAFVPDPDASGKLFNGGFFVVIDDRCRAEPLTAIAVLEDANGEVRCGELRFMADCGD